MKILEQLPEISPYDLSMRCRQNRLWLTINLVATLLLLSAAVPFVFWIDDCPWWARAVAIALATFMIPLFISSLRAILSDKNWTLIITMQGLYINLRSCYNYRFPPARTVLYLPYDNIAAAWRCRHRYIVAGADTTICNKLYLHLRLSNSHTAELADAIREERTRKVRSGCLGVTILGRTNHQPVTVPEPDLVRITWRGGGQDHVAPGLNRVLELLERYMPVLDSERIDDGDSDKMTDAEIDRLVRDLAASNDTIAASKLLVRHYGFSLAEAKQYIEQLDQVAE